MLTPRDISNAIILYLLIGLATAAYASLSIAYVNHEYAKSDEDPINLGDTFEIVGEAFILWWLFWYRHFR